MTELQLCKFVEKNYISLRWEREKLVAWIPFYCLEEFSNLVGYNLLSDGGLDVRLQSGRIVIDLTEVCEHFDIDPENIYKRED